MRWKLLFSVVVLFLWMIPACFAEEIRIAEGRELFMDPCSRCHPMTDMERGKIAPRIKSMDAFGFGAAMWNQSPNMLKAFASKGWKPPTISPLEMKQIFLFTQIMADNTLFGDPALGKKFVEENHCLTCHSIGGSYKEDVAVDWNRFANITHPTTLMAAVWSHRRKMIDAFREAGVPLPRFQKTDLANLMEYMRATGNPAGVAPILVDLEKITMNPSIFDEFHCNQCHTPSEFIGHPERSLQGVTEALLAHAFMPAFERPPLDGLTMTPEGSLSLAGLVYYYGHLGRSGSIETGKAVFRQHQCVNCHDEPDGPSKGGIRIESVRDEWQLISRIFNKVPSMIEKASLQSRAFPRLTPEEMANLYAYFCSSSPECNADKKIPGFD